jgi:alpha-tubulin suppressor-like RCC1 family protein
MKCAPIFAAGLIFTLGCREDATAPRPSDSAPVLSAASAPLAFIQISVGSAYACGVTSDHRAFCWGDNASGALGKGSTSSVDDFTTKPVPVAGGLHFKMVSAGYVSNCGLTLDDLAYCWGANGAGQLGDGTRTSRNQPVPVSGGRAYRQIKAGRQHTCAVTFADVAYCWGANAFGQLGNGNTTGSRRPVQVAGGLHLRRIFAGGTHTCGATSTGKTYCWGDNTYGQLGDGTTSQRLLPTQVKTSLLFGQLSAGLYHSCGVSNHKAYCWGRNRHGALGNGSVTRQLQPVPVSDNLSFNGVSAGNEGSCGTTTLNLAYCWGFNHSGKVGDGTENIDRLTPRAVVGGLHFNAVVTSLTWMNSCGVTTVDRAYCWGDNSIGQLGIGSQSPGFSSTPLAVVGP